jgi:two-component system chemotaxis response regulator CheB
VKRIVVIGGSAGAIEPICEVLRNLPKDFGAAVLVVVHLGEGNVNFPVLFKHCGGLERATPQDGDPILENRVYFARPNLHLLVEGERLHVSSGPRENRHRPSVDALFRSASRSYGAGVIAVVLSGALDDGTGGVLAVKARGGVVIIQEPEEAICPDMPKSVLRYAKADYCLPAAEIGGKLVELIRQEHGNKRSEHMDEEKQNEKSKQEQAVEVQGDFSLICPDCDGPLKHFNNRTHLEFECEVGHRFSLQGLSEAHCDVLERALWVAYRRFKDQQTIHKMLAASSSYDPKVQKRYEESIEAAEQDMTLVQEILERFRQKHSPVLES